MTPRLSAFGSGLLLLMAASAAAQSNAELDDEVALFQLGKDSARPAESESPSHWTYGARLDLALTSLAGQPDTHLRFSTSMHPRLGTLYDFRPDELLQPMAASTYASAHITLSAEWEVLDWLLLRGLIDSGQIRDGSSLDPPVDGVTLAGSPALDALRELDVLRELSAVVGKHAANLELGRFRSSLADGLVYDGFGTGARARLDLDALHSLPVSAELIGVGLADRLSQSTKNPLLALRLRHELSLFESIGVFGAVVWDRNGAMSEVMRSALAQRLLDAPLALNVLFADDRGHTTMAYTGADAELELANGVLLRTAAALSFGQFKLPVGGAFGGQERQMLIDMLGGAADAELRCGLGHGLEFEAFAFALSGSGPPEQGHTYHAFISPAPFWVWTGLFFSGGLNQSLFDDRAALGGVHGHGVAGGGPGIAFHERPWAADLRAIWLQALSDPLPAPWGGGGRSYGLELDARVQWRPLRWLEFGAELDTLFASNYFPRQRVAYRALGLASVHDER